MTDVTSLERGQWREVQADQLPRKALPVPAAPSSPDEPPAVPAEPQESLAAPTEAPADSPAPAEPPTTAATSAPMQPEPAAAATPEPVAETPPPDAAPIEKLSPQESSAQKRIEVEQQPPKLRLERRQELEHRLKASPTDLDAYLELGRIYRAENRPLDARRVFQQAIQIFPDEKELLWEYEEAILARSLQQLREVADLAQRLDTVETERELKRSQNDWANRRMDICRARLARDSSLIHLRIALAEAMYDGELFEAALEELDPILDNDELSPAAYLIRGRCLLAMGKELEAMKSLRAVALRRAIVAPLKTRVIALRLLAETAERLGVALTLENYRQHLQQAEIELAAQNST